MTRSEHKYVTVEMLMASSHHGCQPFLITPSPTPHPCCRWSYLSGVTSELYPCQRKHWIWWVRMLFPTGPGTTCSSHTRRDKVDRLKLLLKLYPGPLTEQGGQPAAIRAAAREGDFLGATTWHASYLAKVNLNFFNLCLCRIFYHLHYVK